MRLLLVCMLALAGCAEVCVPTDSGLDPQDDAGALELDAGELDLDGGLEPDASGAAADAGTPINNACDYFRAAAPEGCGPCPWPEHPHHVCDADAARACLSAVENTSTCEELDAVLERGACDPDACVPWGPGHD